MGAGAGHGQEDREGGGGTEEEVSDARRQRCQTRGGIPRGRYQTRGAEGAYGRGGGTEDR